MSRHYGLKPYECKVCGKAFSEMCTVYKHIKTHEQQDKVLELLEEQVLVREVPSLQLTDIVHAEVEDIGEDLVEDGLVIQAGGSHGAKEEQGKEEEEQVIYLETTAMDGSISNTAAPRAAIIYEPPLLQSTHLCLQLII